MNFDMALFVEAMIHRSPGYITEHLQLTLIPLFLAVSIALPAAVIVTRPGYRRYAAHVMTFFNAGQTIPPLAVIAVFFPFLGLGYGPALFALTIYALLPIARSSIAAISSVPDFERARGCPRRSPGNGHDTRGCAVAGGAAAQPADHHGRD